MLWKIVRKSNLNKELFVEVFIEPLSFVSQAAANEVAEHLNDLMVCDHSEYFYEVERSDYKLYNGYKELL